MTRPALRLITLGSVLLATLSAQVPAAAFEPAYESINTFTLHPGGILRGADYRVLPETVNRGLMNHYRIETRYGLVTADSDRELLRRISEIRALGQLQAMHEGLLVAESIGGTVWRTAGSIVRVVRDPAGVAEGLRDGIERMLRRSGRKLRTAYNNVRRQADGTEDDARSLSQKARQAGATFARNRLGVSRAYRELAREVGVDPYTRNRMLVAELDRLAKHAAGASLGSRLVMPRIPGLIGTVDNVSMLVWEKDRLDLLLHNEDALSALSIPAAIVRNFTHNTSYTPTQQTAIVSSVTTMAGVKNLWRLIDYAADADGHDEAEFYTAMTGLLSLYHRNRSPLLSIHATDSFVPLAFTRDTRAIVAFPVDRARWTRSMAKLISELSRSRARGVKHREIWITGTVSGSAGDELSGRRWIPFNRAHQRLDLRHTGRDGIETL